MVMVVSMLFGAISGSGVADVVAIGSILLPAMKQQRYRNPSVRRCWMRGHSAIIPPSIVMVVLGVSMGTSIGKLFLGGVILGIITGLGLMAISYMISLKENYPRLEKLPGARCSAAAGCPCFRCHYACDHHRQNSERNIHGYGSRMSAALYALLSMFVYWKLTEALLRNMHLETARTSAVVLFLIAAASLFGWVLAAENIPQTARKPCSPFRPTTVVLILFNILLLVLGMFMETIAIILIVIPIFFPFCSSWG